MLASLADAPLLDKSLVYEPKYDGIRAIVEVAPKGGPVKLWSRLGNDKGAAVLNDVVLHLIQAVVREIQPLVGLVRSELAKLA